ncbi:hypothetical protein [Thioalkalivibrio sp. XN8]|uniref:hypothetical protein n=1 Tax=Thioalkalivibrio sp. XN8 TaxID=2712863 RepID=UPI0013EC8BA3|nr:hypothetical protein [Thioalkalivibrio sp. XN8]NGP52014.1 hypothetical protein [Thioalkalivibrio sp. XN8]
MNYVVELVRKADGHGVSIEARITTEGDLLLVGREELPVEAQTAGPAEQEYWLRVPAAAKDAALLSLLENFFGGNALAVSDLRAVLIATGVPCELYSQ